MRFRFPDRRLVKCAVLGAAVLVLAWSAAGGAAPTTTAPTTSGVGAEKPRLAVLDFNVGEDIKTGHGVALAAIVREECQNSQRYDLMDRNMMKERMTEKDFAATAECNEVRCLVRYGKTLDVHKIIGGFATSFGKSWMVTLRMVDVNTGREEKTFSQDCRGDMECLLALSRQGARILLGLEPSAGDVLTLDLGGGVKMELVLIPAGEFWMGSPDGEGHDSQRPRHRVRISRPFYMGRTEVTVAQFRRFVDDTRYVTDAEKGRGGGVGFWNDRKGGHAMQPDGSLGWREDASWRNSGFEQGDDHPVVLVSWNDAVAFCEWLGRKNGRSIRLPTEAEWEYACRAGTSTRFSFGDSDGDLGEYAWYFANSAKQTHPVGRKKPNAWELHDMQGNVAEWCADWYGPYSAWQQVDPIGPASGEMRVARGGDSSSSPSLCDSAGRGNSVDRLLGCVFIGLRCSAGTE